MQPIDKGHHLFEGWAVDYITNLPATAEGYFHLLFIENAYLK